jgi:hypothetical protein
MHQDEPGDRDAQEDFIQSVRDAEKRVAEDGTPRPPRTWHEHAEEGAREARRRLAENEDDAD